MDFKNLHSILSSPWLINDQAEKALMPVLLNILQKGDVKEEEKQKLTYEFYSVDQPGMKAQNMDENLPEKSVVAILPIKGVILKYSDYCTTGTKEYTQVLEGWKNNKAIAGVVLDIDSGGGMVAGTPEFADYIKNYPKPLVSYTDGMMASAAYYLAAASKKIIANPYADAIGSIGTMFKSVSWDGYYKKMGAQVIEAYASQSTQKNRQIRDAAKEENPSTEKLIKEWLDPLNERFIEFVAENRPDLSEEAKTGKDYVLAEESLKNGLIDSIGTLQDAIDTVFTLSKEKKSNIETMSETKSYPKIAAVLQIETISATGWFGAKTANFTEAQLDLIESKLGEDSSSAIAEAVKEKEEIESTLQAEKNRNSAIEAAIKEALKKSDIAASGDVVKNIEALTARIKELGAQNGDTPTNVYASNDSVEETSSEKDLLNQSYKVLLTD